MDEVTGGFPQTGVQAKIGQLLVSMQRMREDQIPEVIEAQHKTGETFGAVAVALGFVSKEDVEEAIAHQFDYAILSPEYDAAHSDLHVATQPSSAVAESFRALRSHLVLNQIEKGQRAIAVVSPSEAAGTSFTAANLAIAFAQSGIRCALVDGNMRRPALHDLFQLTHADAGLSDVLVGNCDIADVLHHHLFPNLSVLPCGRTPPNPQELLGRNEFVWAISFLLSEYDVVLVDTPPMSNSADTRVIAVRLGSALMVARKHKTYISDMQKSAAELERVGVELVGTLLNS